MKYMKTSLVVSLIAVCTACIAYAYPQPRLAPPAKVWTQEVKFEHPRQISLKLDGQDKPVRYWYVILTLTNTSMKDVNLYPQFELMTDTYQIIPAGQGVSRAVFEKIKLSHQGKYPFLEWVQDIDNRMLRGTDNTRDIAVIWPDFDTRAKNVSFFFTGLSNETAVVAHPMDENKTFILQKTLALDYAVPGDKAARNLLDLKFFASEWVMR